MAQSLPKAVTVNELVAAREPEVRAGAMDCMQRDAVAPQLTPGSPPQLRGLLAVVAARDGHRKAAPRHLRRWAMASGAAGCWQVQRQGAARALCCMSAHAARCQAHALAPAACKSGMTTEHKHDTHCTSGTPHMPAPRALQAGHQPQALPDAHAPQHQARRPAAAGPGVGAAAGAGGPGTWLRRRRTAQPAAAGSQAHKPAHAPAAGAAAAGSGGGLCHGYPACLAAAAAHACCGCGSGRPGTGAGAAAGTAPGNPHLACAAHAHGREVRGAAGDWRCTPLPGSPITPLAVQAPCTTLPLPTAHPSARSPRAACRFGHVLALHAAGRGRGSRACLRQAASGLVMHDASYWVPIELEGPWEGIQALLCAVRWEGRWPCGSGGGQAGVKRGGGGGGGGAPPGWGPAPPPPSAM